MSDNHVFIDGYFLGQPSGYGRFVFELCRCVGKIDADFKFTVLVRTGTDVKYTPDYPNIRYIFAPARPFPLWEQLIVPAWAHRSKSKLVHFPYNTRALYVGRNSVTTVHDLTFFNSEAKRDFKAGLIHRYMRMAFDRGTRKSTQIIAVSDTTRRALGQIGLASSRVYNTVDGFLETSPATLKSSGRPYFLHRGSYAPGHRNTERIIKAFLSVPFLREHYDLKILGAPDGAQVWNTQEERSVDYLHRISDAELASLYAGSSCVVAASLLEGFCLPIVEAFGFCSPVIASNIDPMKEIAGDAALLVDPANQDEIASAMQRIATEPELAAGLVEKGKVRLATFSWEAIAQELLAVYRSAIESKYSHELSKS